MKKNLLIISMITAGALSSFAQTPCTVDAALVSTGSSFQILPDTNNILTATAGGAFSQTFSIYTPDTISITVTQGSLVATVDSVNLLDFAGDFTGLGFTADCGGPCVILGGGTGCITVTGTFPAANDVNYDLEFKTDPFGTVISATGLIAQIASPGSPLQSVMSAAGGAAALPAAATYAVQVGNPPCAVNPALTTTGTTFAIMPDTNNTITQVPNGKFRRTFSFYLPDTLVLELGTLGGITADVDSAKLFALKGDFAGFTLDCHGPCTFAAGTTGCVTVSGTMPATDNKAYALEFKIDPFGTILSATGQAADVVTAGADIQATLTPLGGAEGILPAMATYDVHVGTPTDIEDFDFSGNFTLAGNYPNPFDNTTNITFNTTVSGNVSFVVVDILGRQVYDTNITATVGSNTFTYSTDLASGTYFFSLSDGTDTITKKIVVSRN